MTKKSQPYKPAEPILLDKDICHNFADLVHMDLQEAIAPSVAFFKIRDRGMYYEIRPKAGNRKIAKDRVFLIMYSLLRNRNMLNEKPPIYIR